MNAPYTPWPGMRVKDGKGMVWEWRVFPPTSDELAGWYYADRPELLARAGHEPHLTRIAELEAELARYRALGKDAAEGMPAAQFPNGTNILEWRAMKMRELADLYRETTTKEEA